MTDSDTDNDTIITDAPNVSPLSPIKSRLSFDWFRFDTNAKVSPLSPPSTDRRLSTSTASPTSYFNAGTGFEDSEGIQQVKAASFEPRLPDVPSKPLNWVWQCHLCRSRYPLAVTRRCLVDGHYYCSGDTSQRNVKRKRKAQSCTSEFDYVGWQEWGQWKRKCTAFRAYANGHAAPKLFGCEGCSFPSQCRYESRVHTEVLSFEKFITKAEMTALKKEISIAVKDVTSDACFGSSEKENLANNSSSVKLLYGDPMKRALGSTPSDEKQKGKQKDKRFYSAVDNKRITSTMEADRLDNEFVRGRFDPTLPSLQPIPPTSDPSKPLNHSNIDTIEAVLKASLPNPRPGVKSAVSAPTMLTSAASRRLGETDTTNLQQSSKKSTIASVERSKIAKSSTKEDKSNIRKSETQSLLSDWFRQSKQRTPKPTNDRMLPEDDHDKASKEVEIASFLQLKTSSANHSLLANPGLQTEVQTRNLAGTNFEDIAISPVALIPPSGEKTASEPLTSLADGTTPEKSTSFLFPSFVFGR